MNQTKKIGFWAVFSIVVGSQIGSGAFNFPSLLAPYGAYSIPGWVLSGFVVMALAIVFAELCRLFPQTGGPHVYVNQAFGKKAAFFVGWTYWVISWVSSSAVVIACIAALKPIWGEMSQSTQLLMEIGLLLSITGLNLKGVQAAGRAEFFLTLLKFIPLLLLPILALPGFQWEHFALDSSLAQSETGSILGRAILITLWGFIGVEAATTPAAFVENPRRTIPLAIITGTACVALLYLINSVSIMGFLPGASLKTSAAPYVDATDKLFSGNWYVATSLIACVVCVGTLNAWTLTSGQISLGLAQDKLMPPIFARKNRYEAPYVGLLTSGLGMIPILILSSNKGLVDQVNWIVDVSVVCFLFVYILCSLGLIWLKWKHGHPVSMLKIGLACIVCLFFSWVIYETNWHETLVSFLFVLSGVPLYFLWYRKKQLK